MNKRKFLKTGMMSFLMIILLFNCQSQQTQKEVSKVTRYGSLIKVRPEFEERYIILHKHTFPEVLEQIRRSNIRNYSIYIKDGVLFSYFEYIGQDFDADMVKMKEDQTTREWWKLTDPMQEPIGTRKEGEWWASMEEVFHMDAIKKPSKGAKRYGSVIELRPEVEQEYKKIHAAVWPTVLDQIQRSNIQNYSIYLKDGRLYSYFEYTGSNFDADMKKMADDPETQKWWAVTKPMQSKLSTAKENEWWAGMDEVFHTE